MINRGTLRSSRIGNGGTLRNDSTTAILNLGEYFANDPTGITTNKGTMSITGGDNIRNSGTMTNDGTITIAKLPPPMQSFFTNGGTFTNNGSITVGDYFQTSAGTFTNNGILNYNGCFLLIDGGKLVLNTNPAALPPNLYNWNSGGTITVGPSGNLTLPSSLFPTIILSGRTLEVAGMLTINSGATLQNDAGGLLTLSGRLNSNGSLNNSGTMHIAAGSDLVLNTNPGSLPGGTFLWDSLGTVTIGPSGNFSGSFTIPPSRTLLNKGTLTIPSSATLIGNGELTNWGTLNLNTGGNILFRKNGGSWPDSTLNWNTGSTITIDTTGNYTVKKPLSVPSGSTLELRGTFATPNIDNSGTVNLNSPGKLILASSPAYLPGGNFNWNPGSTVAIDTNATFPLGLDGTPSLTILAGRTLRVNGTMTINQASPPSFATPLTIDSAGVLINNGTLNMLSSGRNSINKAGTLTNTGTLNLNPSGSLSLSNAWPSGTFNWGSGSSVFISGAVTLSTPLTVDTNRTLTVQGTLINNSTLTVRGVLTPISQALFKKTC